jgi:8-amino-7-oxononanoate synthase
MSYSRYSNQLAQLKDKGNLRILRDTVQTGKQIEYAGASFLNFSSNDYLGISSNTELWQKFQSQRHEQEAPFNGGACSSRLLTGNATGYTELEQLLAHLYQRDAALVFNSGYHANIGILPALSTKNDLILADKLVHASIIDGLKLSDAKIVRFKHNDLAQIDDLLTKDRHLYDMVFIATESVFSMDGDRADLAELVRLKTKHDAFLYIDEAHATGVLGNKGLGLCEEAGLIAHIDFIVGTFGKAVASQGAYLICDDVIRDYLINTMRSLIFTTALPPFSLQWTLWVVKEMVGMNAQRRHLNHISTYFREQLHREGYQVVGSSQIVPVVTGQNQAAVDLSKQLQAQGIFALPVRPPTVPEGTARIRFSLSSHFTVDDIDKVIDVLKKGKDDATLA